jgi:hypothetical protein
MELPTDEHMSVNLTLSEEQLTQYQGQLNSEMSGKPSSLVARLFKVFSLFSFFFSFFFSLQVLTGKKVTIPGGSFKSSTGERRKETSFYFIFYILLCFKGVLWFRAVWARRRVICTCWSVPCFSLTSRQSTSCTTKSSRWSFKDTVKSHQIETLIWR